MRLPRVRLTVRRMMIAVAIVAIPLGWVAWCNHYPGRPLDPVAWKDPSQVERGIRLAMADRLVAWGTLRRKTRSQVVELLGEPPDTGYFRSWDLVYWLGPERGYISIDSEWLVLRLGQDGRVIDSRIVRD